MSNGKVFSLIRSLPSPLSADERSVFVRMVHRYYAAVDSSVTYTRAVWPGPSPADLPDWASGVSAVSRFLCMKFLGVPGVFDYAGLSMDSRCRPCSCCLPHIFTASASGL